MKKSAFFLMVLFWASVSWFALAHGYLLTPGPVNYQIGSGDTHNPIAGALVQNRDGEKLGRVGGLIADGKSLYMIVVPFSSQISDRLVAIPDTELETFWLSPGNAPLTILWVNVSLAELEAAPTVPRSDWPQRVGKDWMERSFEHFAKAGKKLPVVTRI